MIATIKTNVFALKHGVAAGVAGIALLFGATMVETVVAQSGGGAWTMKAPLPARRAEVAAAALDGKLHAVGGSVAGTAGTYHDEYDPATDAWRQRAPLLEARDHLGVAVAGGKILCVRRLCRLRAQRSGVGCVRIRSSD
jgi:hypothetical protein